MHDLEVRYSLVEGKQDCTRFRIHHGLLGRYSGKFTDCLHRLPKREHDKFNRAVSRAPEQVCSAMSFDRGE